jgi:hypothetical protein
LPQHDLSVRMVSIYSVEQAPWNPHNGDVDAIAESMEQNGVFQPIVVQKSTRHIISGNHRWAAMARLGMTEVPIIEVDVDERRAKRIALADNRTARLGWDDEAMVADILQSLHATNDGLAGTGYAFEEMARLQKLLDEPLTPSDFETADDPGPLSEEVQRDLRRHLKYELSPVVSEDGRVYAITLRKDNQKAITLNEANMIRKALGQDPLLPDEVSRIPAWGEKNA